MGLFKRTVKRGARKVAVTCKRCGKRYTNPLTHTCVIKTDFAKRKRAAERAVKRERERQRKREAAARRREAARARRKAAADRRKAAADERRRKARAPRSAPARRPPHEYRTCREEDCRRHACLAYKDGYQEGLAACPLPHQDGG